MTKRASLRTIVSSVALVATLTACESFLQQDPPLDI
jgi:hypothetical protein